MLRQKSLQVKLKNTLQNTPLVLDSVSSELNREETLSVQDKVRACNNPEVDQLQRIGDQNLRVSDKVYVFVLNIRGEPLMPTSCRKARLFLKQGRAIVTKRFPFTIKLTYVTGENRQKVTLGLDTGYSHIGFSCITDKKELIRGEVNLDNKTKLRLIKRSMYRRLKRSKLRYRKPRFLNRKKCEGWIPPSILRRYNTHLNLIKLLRKLLFIDNIKIEIGNFDIQKLNNPDIQGEQYQQGNLYNYENVKSFILNREKGMCQLCNKKYIKGNHWRLHHVIERSRGGSNKVDNLSLLHKKCHFKLHKNNLKLKKNKQYIESIFINIIKNRFQKDLNCELTYGYETYIKRNELNLEKSHSNDSFIIAGGNSQSRSFEYKVEQKRKNNRCLQLNRKGFKPSIRRKRYSIQPKDLVKVNNEMFEVIGICNYGKSVIVKKNNKKISFNTKKINWHFNVKTLNFKIGKILNNFFLFKDKEYLFFGGIKCYKWR